MLVSEIINHAVVQANRARVGEIPNDLWDHCLRSLNMSYQQVWDLFPWNVSKQLNVQVSTSTGELVLPHYIDNVRAARIGNTPIFAQNEILVTRFDPQAFENTGTPVRFTWNSPVPVQTQPSAATVVKIKSSSASDTSRVRVTGTVGGLEDYEDITLTGTTIAAGAKLFTEIRKIAKAITVGRITVMDSADAELGTIAPWTVSPEYLRIQLTPVPTEATTVTMQCLRRFERLTDEYDVVTPTVFAPAVMHLVTAAMFRQTGENDRAMIEEKLAREAIKGVASDENDQNETDFSVVPLNGAFGDLGIGGGDYDSGWPYEPTR